MAKRQVARAPSTDQWFKSPPPLLTPLLLVVVLGWNPQRRLESGGHDDVARRLFDDVEKRRQLAAQPLQRVHTHFMPPDA